MCRLGLFVVILAASVSRAQELIDSWYPHQPGASWVYQNEALAGDMGHPEFERWTTEETSERRE